MSMPMSSSVGGGSAHSVSAQSFLGNDNIEFVLIHADSDRRAINAGMFVSEALKRNDGTILNVLPVIGQRVSVLDWAPYLTDVELMQVLPHAADNELHSCVAGVAMNLLKRSLAPSTHWADVMRVKHRLYGQAQQASGEMGFCLALQQMNLLMQHVSSVAAPATRPLIDYSRFNFVSDGLTPLSQMEEVFNE